MDEKGIKVCLDTREQRYGRRVSTIFLMRMSFDGVSGRDSWVIKEYKKPPSEKQLQEELLFVERVLEVYSFYMAGLIRRNAPSAPSIEIKDTLSAMMDVVENFNKNK